MKQLPSVDRFRNVYPVLMHITVCAALKWLGTNSQSLLDTVLFYSVHQSNEIA